MKRLFVLAAVALLTLAASAQLSADAGVPAYHAAPPMAHRALPPILKGEQLTGTYFTHPYQAAVYGMAAAIPEVVYQLPCYCRCDRALGHKSLHSCFEGTHGATCSVCLREAAYAYQQTRLGRSPAQIRQGIEDGDYAAIDLRTLGADSAPQPVPGGTS